MSIPTSELIVRAAPRGGADGAARFLRAMQSALTRQEVAEAYLGQVGTVIEANAVGLYQLEEETLRVLDVRVQSGREFLDAYELYGRDDDPVLQHVVAHRVAIDSSRLPPRQWHPCGARQALRFAGYEHSLEAPVIVGGVFFGTINFARDPSRDPFSTADLVAAESIAVHLGLAMERSLRHEQVLFRTQVLEHAVDRLPQPVIVTALDGSVLLRNAAAQVWSGDDCLGRVIEQACADFVEDGRRVAVRTVTSSGRSAVARTVRLADRLQATVTLLFNRGEELADGKDELPAMDVLTPREQDIVRLVSRGLRTRDIAEQAFISENTVKQHLKRIYAKTDVRNRAELIQLVWRSGSA